MKEGSPTQTYQKVWQPAHSEDDTERERDMYGGGAGPTGVMNVGGGDGGTRLAVAEGVVLREACIEETTSECREYDRGARELPPEVCEERDKA